MHLVIFALKRKRRYYMKVLWIVTKKEANIGSTWHVEANKRMIFFAILVRSLHKIKSLVFSVKGGNEAFYIYAYINAKTKILIIL